MEQKGDNGRLYQEWSKKYTLPDEADAAKLKSLLSKDGILQIEAPVSNLNGSTPIEISIYS